MKYDVCLYGDPVLRQAAVDIDVVDDEVRALAEDMIETMRTHNGVGLAAQQIGRTLSICVVDVPPQHDEDETGLRLNPDIPMPLVLINPEITSSSVTLEKGEEGCLSFPGITGTIPRSSHVTVKFLDREGVPQERALCHFVARVAQHEIDHLNGVLFIDRMSPVKRVALSGPLKRMRKETRQKLSVV